MTSRLEGIAGSTASPDRSRRETRHRRRGSRSSRWSQQGLQPVWNQESLHLQERKQIWQVNRVEKGKRCRALPHGQQDGESPLISAPQLWKLVQERTQQRRKLQGSQSHLPPMLCEGVLYECNDAYEVSRPVQIRQVGAKRGLLWWKADRISPELWAAGIPVLEQSRRPWSRHNNLLKLLQMQL